MARLIDADEFMKNFDKEIENGATDAFDAVEDALEETPTIEAEPVKQEWIDVHDRLPDKDTLVLCVGAKGGMFLGFVRYLYGDDKTAYVRVPNARGGRYAAFWMPLPEPPKEE